MSNATLEAHIAEHLSGELRNIALEFAAFLRSADTELVRGGGYWEGKPYWLAAYNGEFVCALLIGAEHPNQNPNTFTIWSDNCGTTWYENTNLDDNLKEAFWQSVDFCGSCGFCSGGTRKIIFGREFDNVCGTTFRFDNPDRTAIKCAIKMVELRKNDISAYNNSPN